MVSRIINRMNWVTKNLGKVVVVMAILLAMVAMSFLFGWFNSAIHSGDPTHEIQFLPDEKLLQKAYDLPRIEKAIKDELVKRHLTTTTSG